MKVGPAPGISNRNTSLVQEDPECVKFYKAVFGVAACSGGPVGHRGEDLGYQGIRCPQAPVLPVPLASASNKRSSPAACRFHTAAARVRRIRVRVFVG